jgi:hypothetical protein
MYDEGSKRGIGLTIHEREEKHGFHVSQVKHVLAV